MAVDPEQERLRALEERIARARAAAEPRRSAASQGYSQGEVAWRMVIELVSGLVIGLGIGMGLDALFGTRPLFLVLFVVIGLVAGVKVMLQSAHEMQKKSDADQQSARDEGN
ncbi:AtpZ/AtpI family protein [Plastorhodobacter daqingensis]|uniref:ATP synthase protein I n=1 Tax=Plastorhodobacter daqingensis TaxID=1387281 RepID=A0ABW2UGD1_9RHOB